MINKTICLITCATMLVLYSGCANCSLRNWFRGATCNTCQPPVGQPIGCGTNYAPLCESGVCGSAPVNANPVMETPAVNGPYLEAPEFIPQSSAPYFSGPGNSPAMNETSYASPMGTISGTGVPSGEVYGSGRVKNSWAPPSLGIFRKSGSRN